MNYYYVTLSDSNKNAGNLRAVLKSDNMHENLTIIVGMQENP